MQMISWGSILLCAAASLSNLAVAQDSRDSRTNSQPLVNVHGSVNDRAGKPAGNINVFIQFGALLPTDVQINSLPRIVTDDAGKFRTYLPAGRYKLCALLVLPSYCVDLNLDSGQPVVDTILNMPGLTSTPPASLDVLRERLIKLAGETAVDCGLVEKNVDPTWANSCVAYCVKRKKPFYVQFRQTSTDSVAADALAGDSAGHVYKVAFDSIGIHGAGREGKDEDGGHTLIQPCQLLMKSGANGIALSCREDSSAGGS